MLADKEKEPEASGESGTPPAKRRGLTREFGKASGDLELALLEASKQGRAQGSPGMLAGLMHNRHTQAVERDGTGLVVLVQYASGGERKFAYEAGRLSELVDKDGSTWKSRGENLWVQFAASGSVTGEIWQGMVDVDKDGNYIFEDSLEGSRVVERPDGSRLVEEPAGYTIEAGPRGQVTKITYPDGDHRLFKYGPSGHLAEITDSRGCAWKRMQGNIWAEFDSAGTPTGQARTGEFSVNDEGDFAFHADGSPEKSILKPYGAKITFTKDGTTITEDPDGSKTVEKPDGQTVYYNPDGVMLTRTETGTLARRPDGSEAEADHMGRITIIRYTDGSKRSFKYDGGGELAQYTDCDGTDWVKTEPDKWSGSAPDSLSADRELTGTVSLDMHGTLTVIDRALGSTTTFTMDGKKESIQAQDSPRQEAPAGNKPSKQSGGLTSMFQAVFAELDAPAKPAAESQAPVSTPAASESDEPAPQRKPPSPWGKKAPSAEKPPEPPAEAPSAAAQAQPAPVQDSAPAPPEPAARPPAPWAKKAAAAPQTAAAQAGPASPASKPPAPWAKKSAAPPEPHPDGKPSQAPPPSPPASSTPQAVTPAEPQAPTMAAPAATKPVAPWAKKAPAAPGPAQAAKDTPPAPATKPVAPWAKKAAPPSAPVSKEPAAPAPLKPAAPWSKGASQAKPPAPAPEAQTAQAATGKSISPWSSKATHMQSAVKLPGDPTEGRTVMEMDWHGRIVRIKYPDNTFREFEYDDTNKLRLIRTESRVIKRNPDHSWTTYTHDDRKEHVSDPAHVKLSKQGQLTWEFLKDASKITNRPDCSALQTDSEGDLLQYMSAFGRRFYVTIAGDAEYSIASGDTIEKIAADALSLQRWASPYYRARGPEISEEADWICNHNQLDRTKKLPEGKIIYVRTEQS